MTLNTETAAAEPEISTPHREPPITSAWKVLKDPQARGILLPIVGFLVLGTYFALNSPGFLTLTNLSLILLNASVLLIVAIGASWVILMGSIDLSNGAIVVLAGLISATVVQDQPAWVAFLAGLGCAVVAGMVNGFVFAYLRLPSFLVTLGTSLIISGIGLTIVGGRTVQIFDKGFTQIAQGRIVSFLPNLVLWAFLVFLVAAFVGFKTKFGRYAMVIGGGERVAALSGVPVRRYKFFVFVVSAFLAGLGGVLLASRLNSGSPGVGNDLVLLTIAAVVMSGTPLTGGIGGAHRTIIGVLVIGILQNGLSGMGVGPFQQSIIQGLVVIVAVASTIDRSRLSVLK